MAQADRFENEEKGSDENGAFDDQRDCQYGKRKIGCELSDLVEVMETNVDAGNNELTRD